MTQPGRPVASCVRIQPGRHEPQKRQVWGSMPGIPELETLRQENSLEAKANLSRIETCFETKLKVEIVWLFRMQHRCSPCFPDGSGEACSALKKRVSSFCPWQDSHARCPVRRWGDGEVSPGCEAVWHPVPN